jgi:hypothetical protein
MTTGIEELKLPVRKKGRGPGKKPALVCTSLRLSREAVEFYKKFENPQVKMREVLTEYVLDGTTKQGEANVD